jgi:hypothetical protein
VLVPWRLSIFFIKLRGRATVNAKMTRTAALSDQVDSHPNVVATRTGTTSPMTTRYATHPPNSRRALILHEKTCQSKVCLMPW